MKDQIRKIIYQAIETQEILLHSRVDRSRGDAAPLFGDDGPFDSMALVSLIVDIEGAIERELKRSVILVSEKAMSATRSPFATIATLVTFLEESLKENVDV